MNIGVLRLSGKFDHVLVSLIDSGLGLLPMAARLRALRPDLDLLLQLDPDGAPWGPKPEEWVVDRVVSAARAGVADGARVVVLPCNTASVTALEHVRSELGPSVPVIGTVPAIKPAAAECESVAIWATAATTSSTYQADLIERFGNGATVVGVACHGLADAIDIGDLPAANAAIARAAASTPSDVGGVVLGCTHYPLMAEDISAALPAGVRLFDSAAAVAAQTIRRIDELGVAIPGSGSIRVVNSGRPGTLPVAALRYEFGRNLSMASSADAP